MPTFTIVFRDSDGNLQYVSEDTPLPTTVVEPEE